MEKLRQLFRLWLVFLFLAINFAGAGIVRAAETTTGKTIRQATIVVSYTRYEWWLLRWFDNQLMCHVYIDHQGLPTANEILTDCGGTIYNQWINTQACSVLDQADIGPTGGGGLYLYFIGSAPAE